MPPPAHPTHRPHYAECDQSHIKYCPRTAVTPLWNLPSGRQPIGTPDGIGSTTDRRWCARRAPRPCGFGLELHDPRGSGHQGSYARAAAATRSLRDRWQRRGTHRCCRRADRRRLRTRLSGAGGGLLLERALRNPRTRHRAVERRRIAREPGHRRMTLDLAQFHQTFFDESFEALGSMEAALLKLSAGEGDAELINTIFRVAHSIKGGSAPFGFADVAAFTHTLETLLDQLRSGQRQVQPITVDLLLRSVDVLREMLSLTQRKQPPDPTLAAGLRAGVRALVKSPAAQGPQGWRVKLVPGPLMRRHGNDPLRILRELSGLGTLVTRVDAGKLPTLAELDPEVCVLGWQMELRGNVDRGAIEQIFEWAEGECTLSIESLSPNPAAQVVAPATAGSAPATPAA